MKPTREEILSICRNSADDERPDPITNDEVWLTTYELERFALAMYRKGQEDMRESAMNIFWCNDEYWFISKLIGELPIEGEE